MKQHNTMPKPLMDPLDPENNYFKDSMIRILENKEDSAKQRIEKFKELLYEDFEKSWKKLLFFIFGNSELPINNKFLKKGKKQNLYRNITKITYKFLDQSSFAYSAVFRNRKIKDYDDASMEQSFKLVTAIRFLNDVLYELRYILKIKFIKDCKIVDLIFPENPNCFSNDNESISFLRCLTFNHALFINSDYLFKKRNKYMLIGWKYSKYNFQKQNFKNDYTDYELIRLANKKDNNIVYDIYFKYQSLKDFLFWRLLNLTEWYYKFYQVSEILSANSLV